VRGRGPGPGSLTKTASGWLGVWSDAQRLRHRRILGQTKDEAQRALAKIIRDRDLELTGLGAETLQQRQVSEIVERYLLELATYRRPSYLRTTKMSLTRLVTFLGPMRICDLRVERVLEFRRKRLADGASNRTCNLDIGSLRTALRWAISCGLIHVTPLAHLRPLPTDESTQRRRRRALGEDELARFIAAAEDLDVDRAARFAAERTIASGARGKAYATIERQRPVPQALMWKTLVATGMRWGEIATLRWCDIEEDHGLLRVRSEVAKSRRSRIVPVQAPLLAEILGLRRAHVRATGRLPAPTDNVFLTPKGRIWKQTANGPLGRVLRGILKRAGIAEVTERGSVDVHALRKSACTRMLRFGVPLATVARVVGHADVRITAKHYEGLSDGDMVSALAVMPQIGTKTETHAATLVEAKRAEAS
jgi:integrase